jgi:hypothetical protein
VDFAAVAASFAQRYPKRRYSSIFLGSSNGAFSYLAAAMQAPWLPNTVLVPVARVGDTDRPDQDVNMLLFQHGTRWPGPVEEALRGLAAAGLPISRTT